MNSELDLTGTVPLALLHAPLRSPRLCGSALKTVSPRTVPAVSAVFKFSSLQVCKFASYRFDGDCPHAVIPPRRSQHRFSLSKDCKSAAANGKECLVLSALHGGCVVPTRRVPPPYTEGAISLHGGFDFPTRENGICGGSAGRLAPPFQL